MDANWKKKENKKSGGDQGGMALTPILQYNQILPADHRPEDAVADVLSW
jgi:hypothetical protein